MMKLRVEDTRRQAEMSRALRDAGVVRQPWLTRRSCRVLCQLGRKLVTVGERLKQFDVPPASGWGMQDV
jgi:hypothetical protein